MKKVTTLVFVFALAIGAQAQFGKVPPIAHVPPVAHGKSSVTNSTVPPVAKTRPNAVGNKRK